MGQYSILNTKSKITTARQANKNRKAKHQTTKKSSKITPLTCELELSANLANALALDKSIRSRKNGKASLQKKEAYVKVQGLWYRKKNISVKSRITINYLL